MTKLLEREKLNQVVVKGEKLKGLDYFQQKKVIRQAMTKAGFQMLSDGSPALHIKAEENWETRNCRFTQYRDTYVEI